MINSNEEKNLQAQRETFVASLSHDLKNPTLAQIRALELLLKGNFGNIQPKQKEILEMVLDSCKYMNAMLASLLSTYRSEKGAIVLKYENISLMELASECVEEMIYMAKDKDVQIALQNNYASSNICADKIQIKRVIMNLLSNGIKYAFKNSCINITIFNEQNYPGFQFENNSPFIPEDKQKSLEDKVLTELVRNNKHQKGFRNYLYETSKRNALNRNHDFKLTQDEYEEIIFKDCYYCGEHPKSMTNEQIKNRGNINEPPLFYNGIDRIHSNVGYIQENCVPCCPMCNYMKRIYTQKDCYNQIIKIYKHLN